MSRKRIKLFRGKITIKLCLLISGMFAILVGIIMGAQFLYFNRSYLTTDYTKQRENVLSSESKQFFSYYIEDLITNNQSNMLEGLNAYSSKHSIYAIITDTDGNIMYSSSNLENLKEEYIKDIQKEVREYTFINDRPISFRIDNKYGFPTQYIAMLYGKSFYPYMKPVYLVSIIQEVYTNENYLAVLKFSTYLLVLILILVFIAAYLFSYYITKPVLQMMDMATHLCKLDFSKKCKYDKKDELGILAQSLNEMSDILSKTIAQLEKTNERLEEDIELQKAFVADVSHEFKTPLTIIRGFIEILSDKKVNKIIQEEAMDTITYEVDRMDKLVYDLLKLSKLESQGYILEKKKIHCKELLENIADSYTLLMQSKEIIFLQEYDLVLGDIMADRYSIEQVLRNFISNAITYTRPNGTIRLSATQQNGSIRIAVFNEGQQINVKELDKIWNKFYRTDKARSKETGGTGLGLSICKKILELHGYEYGVMNEKNGVVFYFHAKII